MKTYSFMQSLFGKHTHVGNLHNETRRGFQQCLQHALSCLLEQYTIDSINTDYLVLDRKHVSKYTAFLTGNERSNTGGLVTPTSLEIKMTIF